MSLPYAEENGLPKNAAAKRRLWGCVTRKERWGLSWKGWLLFLFAALAIVCAIFFRVYPFLAPTHRVDTDVLVVEGWIHEYAIRSAVAEFQLDFESSPSLTISTPDSRCRRATSKTAVFTRAVHAD